MNPDKQEFIELLKITKLKDIAKIYGRSEATIYIWMKKLKVWHVYNKYKNKVNTIKIKDKK